jgi:hypothetical protein
LEAALVFSVVIVPGLLLIVGYQRTRAHSLPRRDLYALAQAVAVSLAWLPAMWLMGGRYVVDWIEAGTLRSHDGELIAIVLLNLAAPLLVGLLAGLLVDKLGQETRLSALIGWTGIFEPPTAWEATWLLIATGEWAAVEIRLQGGEQFNVLFDEGSTVGLSPGPRYLFFDTEYYWIEGNDDPEVQGHHGIFIDASEVVSVRIEHLETESAAE